ncbi:MAG TPA: metallophosphoesterase [Phycisphaerae bacterium]|nr:metallophosphoesterase [Phycisphaerae bacterium]
MEAAGKRYIAYGSRSDELSLWCLGDEHIGSPACDFDRLQATVDRIRDDPNAFWLNTGDNAEYISPRDKRFDPTAFDPDIKVVDLGRLGKYFTDRVADLYRPIRHKCLGMGFGNHEDKYQLTKEQQDLHSWLCCELDVPNLGYSALFDVVFVRVPKVKAPTLMAGSPGNPNDTANRWPVRVYTHHGSGAARTEGGKMNRLVEFMKSFEADLFFVGHVHDKVGKRVVQIGANAACDKLTERVKLGMICGSFLKTFAQGMTTYGEKKAYRPVPLGAVCARVRPDARELLGEV